ncbi:MAG: ATP-binding cassette domain-containing protein [Candidatus Lokiarchaeota archaeon]|nr:ATP-binding cassette domain-containing protein [Candidatus Lokiarchaeota archaeon]MBD3199061.1 ATP-binding cassette domain-containing protein [Candidatus Lokiarchaeota archaeon]
MNITKKYGKFKALSNISLEIKDKEYFIVLGPTGAGKTSLLKVIAGLVSPDEGEILFDGMRINEKQPGERNLGFMFENYALFPHMNIVDNISYSSRVHARNPESTQKIVQQFLMMTLLMGRDDALPKELSGGMKQRVALSRALMNLEQTKLLILDEPLKALDAGLRNSLRRELLNMAKSSILDLTVIHVTNDQREAMMVADRIALINQGKVVQVGTPHEIYYHPRNLFVAYFMSEINYFEGKCVKNSKRKGELHKISTKSDKFLKQIQEDSLLLPIDIGIDKIFTVYTDHQKFETIDDGDNILLVVRANHFKIREGNRLKDKKNAFIGLIKRRKFMGVFYRFEVLVKINNKEKRLIISIPATTEIHQKFQEGSNVTVYFPEELGIIFKHPGKDEINRIMSLV